MKTFLKVVLGLVLFIALIIGIAFWSTGGVAESGEQFLKALSSGNNAKAYELTAKAFRDATSQEQLASFAHDYGLDRVKSTSWSNRSFENSSGKLVGTATLDDGSEIPLDIDLFHEDGQWRVLHISSQRGGIEGIAAENSATPPIPDLSQSQALVKQAMHDFAISVNAKDMTGFRQTTSALWQEQFDVQRFNDSFKVFFDLGVDLTELDDMEPLMARAGALDDDSVLVLAGQYDTKPNQVHFEQKFHVQNDEWKLIGFNIDVR